MTFSEAMLFYLDTILATPTAESRRDVPAGQRPCVVEAINCANGVRVSVQASWGHRCLPKGDAAGWTHVEVKTAVAPPSWQKYREDGESDIYNFVPVELVRELLIEYNRPANVASPPPPATPVA